MSYDPNARVDLAKLRSISFSAVAMPSRKPEAAGSALWHQNNELDVPAYRRLRKDGVQPQQVHGSAWLERNADTVEQVEGQNPMATQGLEWDNSANQ